MMRALESVRQVVREYRIAHRTSLRAMIDEALLGTAAILVLIVNVTILLAGAPA